MPAPKRFAAEGAKVAIFDCAAEREAVADALKAGGGEAISVHVDITDDQAVMSAVAEVAAHWSAVDIVVGCAGISGPVGTPLAKTDVAD